MKPRPDCGIFIIMPRFFHTPIFIYAAVLGVLAAFPAMPARAQEQPSAQMPAAVPATLTEALQTLPLNWDTREKGVLFWVVLPYTVSLPRPVQNDVLGFPITVSGGTIYGSAPPPQNPAPLQAERRGDFRVQDIAAHFDRQMVSARTITAFVPNLTTVLATHLPEPDFYANSSRGEKLRRLESTLSAAQWKLLGSSAGLGASDLRPAQKKIWEALLPESGSWTKRRNISGMTYQTIVDQSTPPLVLTQAQKAGTRLVLSRRLDWYFAKLKGGIAYAGQPLSGPEGTDTLVWEEAFSSPIMGKQDTAFGAALKAVVPNTAKLSQLDYASSVLDAGFVLTKVKNVGEVIQQIKQKTGVDLYCDPRYRDLPIYTKGGEQTVRAGDLLEAVARSVCGTFRRVFDKNANNAAAYILTDDIEGLGTRQARIAEWLQAAQIRREAELRETQAALSKTNIGDYVAWNQDNFFAPSRSLEQRIDAYRAGKEAPTALDKSSGARDSGLWVPVEDLPVSVQNSIALQAADYNKRVQDEAQKEQTFRFYDSPLRTDRVQLHVKTRMDFIIPGVGHVEAGFGSGSFPQELLPDPPPAPYVPASKPASNAQTPPPLRLTQVEGNTYALLIALPQTAGEIIQAVAAAKAHGFNQLWVEMPVEMSIGDALPLLSQTIVQAKSGGLKVQAVVPVLRRPAGAAPDLPRAINVLGETMTKWATRRAQQILLDTGNNRSGFDGDAMRLYKVSLENALRQKSRGDFLDTGDPRVEAALLSDLTALARTPGLAGMVACDLSAPGSNGDVSFLFLNREAQSAAEVFGYTDSARLHFLRENGIDPVDLSVLPDGVVASPLAWAVGPYPSVFLPQMPDFGPDASRRTINTVPASNLGAKDAWGLWNAFRKTQADLFWSRLQKACANAAPNVPLMRQNEYRRVVLSSVPVRLSATGPYDKMVPPVSVSAVKPPNTPVKSPSLTPKEAAASYLIRVRQRTSEAFLTVRYDASPAEAFLQPFDKGAQGFVDLLAAYLQPYQGGWDGMVIDLSEMPLDTALPLLQNVFVHPAQAKTASAPLKKP